MNFEKEYFRNLIKNILIENGLVKVSDKTGYYNNNISRESYWENNFPEYKEQFFETYREWRDMFDSEPSVSFFIKCYFFDKNPRSLGLFRRFKDIKDYFENATHSELISKHYHSYFKDEFKDIVDFETDNIYEVKMCFDNGMRERPKCRECGRDAPFTGALNGYFRDFCCFKCQMDYNNKEKTPKLSNLSDDEIREIVSKIPPDRRNLTNPKYADVYLNIYNYSKDVVDLKQNERQFLFMNKLDINYIVCPYCKCHKKIFKSSVEGYRETCGRKSCIKLRIHPNCGPSDEEINLDDRISENRNAILSSSFLYVIYSKKNDFYKIGISVNPTSRVSSFLQFFDDFELKFCVFLKNANDVEYEFKKHFKEKRVLFESSFDGHTEYFKLNNDDLEYIKRVLYENQ